MTGLRYGLLAALGSAALFAGSTERKLPDAVRAGDMATVRTAIETGADVESPDEHGNTLLMHTAVFGKIADLEFLLAHGAAVNAANPAGHTPLMRAIPDLMKIKLLVEHGAKINVVTADGSTPLMIAANVRSAAPLVRYLVASGADLNATNKRGLGAVMLAAEQGAFENLKILLDAGADGAAKTSNRPATSSPGSSAVAGPVQEFTRRRVGGGTALMNAARAGCEPCVRALLEHGADARARTDAGLTALHGASFQGSPALLKLLLDAGASVDAADDRGLTPLMMAVNSRTKSTEAVRILLDRGADTEAKDASGRSVAEWATIGASRGILRMLPAQPKAAFVKTSAPQSDTESTTIRAAVEQSIALLRETGPKFFPKSGCVSCHNVSIPMMALHHARRIGHAASVEIEQMARQTVASLSTSRDNLLSGYCTVPGISTTASYALISIHEAGRARDLLTDGLVRCLMLEQFPDGRWGNGGGERPPLSPESGIPGTALSARAVQLYMPPALAKEVKIGVANARVLLAASPRTGDDYTFRLLGLFWTGATQSQVAAVASSLLAQQRANGGWAQTPDMTRMPMPPGKRSRPYR